MALLNHLSQLAGAEGRHLASKEVPENVPAPFDAVSVIVGMLIFTVLPTFAPGQDKPADGPAHWITNGIAPFQERALRMASETFAHPSPDLASKGVVPNHSWLWYIEGHGKWRYRIDTSTPSTPRSLVVDHAFNGREYQQMEIEPALGPGHRLLHIAVKSSRRTVLDSRPMMSASCFPFEAYNFLCLQMAAEGDIPTLDVLASPGSWSNAAAAGRFVGMTNWNEQDSWIVRFGFAPGSRGKPPGDGIETWFIKNPYPIPVRTTVLARGSNVLSVAEVDKLANVDGCGQSQTAFLPGLVRAIHFNANSTIAYWTTTIVTSVEYVPEAELAEEVLIDPGSADSIYDQDTDTLVSVPR